MAAKVVKRDRKQEEVDQLINNRRYRFRKILGDEWPNDDIEALVNSEHHPTDLEKLLNAKPTPCPPRTAVRILI